MLSHDLQNKIEEALSSVEWGSVEVIVQKNKVTQITVRNISKTDIEVYTSETSVQKNKSNISNRIIVG